MATGSAFFSPIKLQAFLCQVPIELDQIDWQVVAYRLRLALMPCGIVWAGLR